MDGTDQTIVRTPRIHLVRMVVFLILVGFLTWILQQPVRAAFLNNPGLNGLIGVCLAVGVVLALAQVVRLFIAAGWINAHWASRRPGEQLRPGRNPPSLVRPVAVMLADDKTPVNATLMRAILDSIAFRLDDARDILRYLAGLLVFLGLLGTFWGLLETVSSVGGVIKAMRGGGEAGVLLEELKAGLAAPLSGMGISFSSSLFGLAGSLVLGFLDLQLGQAQGRFYNGLEEWLAHGLAASPIDENGAPSGALLGELGQLNENIAAASAALVNAAHSLSSHGRAAQEAARQAADALAARAEPRLPTATPQPDPTIGRLADGITDLVQSMRREQQLIRDWVESQAEQQRRIQASLDHLLRRPAGDD